MEKKNERIVHETEFFKAIAPLKPHVAREDGGHIIIKPKEKCTSRTDLSPQRAKDVMRFTMLLGEAMIAAMKDRGVTIERINYQDNGNWAFHYGRAPSFHVHLYGRVKDSARQQFGQALVFPTPEDEYYIGLAPLDEDDMQAIREKVAELEKTEQYDLKNW